MGVHQSSTRGRPDSLVAAALTSSRHINKIKPGLEKRMLDNEGILQIFLGGNFSQNGHPNGFWVYYPYSFDHVRIEPMSSGCRWGGKLPRQPEYNHLWVDLPEVRDIGLLMINSYSSSSPDWLARGPIVTIVFLMPKIDNNPIGGLPRFHTRTVFRQRITEIGGSVIITIAGIWYVHCSSS